ncbi:MAG TPA: uracil-DNA glycosylase family protein [Chondromyces sp.]|nr:uracil-DNA glycosylase family protein [Chondromyces sp.]
MGIVTGARFHLFKEKIFSLNLPLSDQDLLNSTFLLEKDEEKKLEIYYTPFDYINEKAKVVIVGITPGLHQMKKAYTAVIENRHLRDEELLHEVKKSASFEGTMRKNLTAMLDDLELPRHLGISSSSELFSAASHLVYNTSILPYAVFFNGQNFNGSRPNILKTNMLVEYVKNYFIKDISTMENPLIIPLGVNVSRVLDYFLKNKPVLKGFPHPSGSNGHRHRQFRENKEDMKRQMENYFSIF